ncbi:positive regulation of histone H4-K16 acetylation [Branchiostoma belcheri]|nr:positive regulation of histone H4-K16 acetylation [Branchiostoma belcheri]
MALHLSSATNRTGAVSMPHLSCTVSLGGSVHSQDMTETAGWMRSSYHGKTDDENTRPEGTNANGPSQRASSRDRLSDASTHSSSGRGYMCDSESEDDRAVGSPSAAHFCRYYSTECCCTFLALLSGVNERKGSRRKGSFLPQLSAVERSHCSPECIGNSTGAVTNRALLPHNACLHPSCPDQQPIRTPRTTLDPYLVRYYPA